MMRTTHWHSLSQRLARGRGPGKTNQLWDSWSGVWTPLTCVEEDKEAARGALQELKNVLNVIEEKLLGGWDSLNLEKQKQVLNSWYPKKFVELVDSDMKKTTLYGYPSYFDPSDGMVVLEFRTNMKHYEEIMLTENVALHVLLDWEGAIAHSVDDPENDSDDDERKKE